MFPVPGNKHLKARAQMLEAVRSFFKEKEVLEVDCPLLSNATSIDLHIDPIQTSTHYLITSPEYGMKRLLSEGFGDCYQLGHVFREGERSALHNPEFTLIEWYRLGFSFEEMIKETCVLIELFTGKQKQQSITYQKAFIEYANIDPFSASNDQIFSAIKGESHLSASDDRDLLLNVLLSQSIEPELGKSGLTVLIDYPPSQAALAVIKQEKDIEVAKRFEVYFKGVELANGYEELTDAKKQRSRLEKANRDRKQPLPIDDRFLKALEKGLPKCCGVAVGFDRLLMLMLGEKHIDHILPFSWENS